MRTRSKGDSRCHRRTLTLTAPFRARPHRRPDPRDREAEQLVDREAPASSPIQPIIWPTIVQEKGPESLPTGSGS